MARGRGSSSPRGRTKTGFGRQNSSFGGGEFEPPAESNPNQIDCHVIVRVESNSLGLKLPPKARVKSAPLVRTIRLGLGERKTELETAGFASLTKVVGTTRSLGPREMRKFSARSAAFMGLLAVVAHSTRMNMQYCFSAGFKRAADRLAGSYQVSATWQHLRAR